MTTTKGPQLDTWPFWAPSRAESVDHALTLAGVGPGVRVCDLGCGDGQVLAAAADRGATVSGVEADPDLVAEAVDNLRGRGVDADIREGDLFDPGLVLDADVFFAYLAPATLQRLLPTLQRHPGTRLVTVDFDVPGLVPTRRHESARLYRLPGRRRPVGTAGWPTAGTLVATAPDCQSLTCLDLVHPGGRSTVRLSRGLGEFASILGGADSLDAPAQLAVDLRWEPNDLGTVAGGRIHLTGVDDHALFLVVTDEDEGVWELEPAAVEAIRRGLRRRTPPTTLAELLDLTAV